jgi:class 3 adenylate cyclase/tetratricopeptide (TPR) repeat protein
MQSSRLASFLPRFQLERIAQRSELPSAPSCVEFEAAVLVVDLAGFTRLTMQYHDRGSRGAEELSEFTSAYFGQTSSTVLDYGGDVLVFAGDSVVAMWPAQGDLERAVCRASQCSRALHGQFATGLGGSADARCYAAIGAGALSFLEIGGYDGEWLALFAGDSIRQLERAVAASSPGETVLSPEAWQLLRPHAEGTPTANDAIRLRAIHAPAPLPDGEARPILADDALIRHYLPEPVAERIASDTEQWIAEFRHVTIVFVNLPAIDVADASALEVLQHAVTSIQQELAAYEGILHRMLMDEKGVSLVLGFGLPPLSHERDAERALVAALSIRRALGRRAIQSAVGIASGQVFCGICGNQLRRQYTILGPTINLAARLMRVGSDDLLCDAVTAQAAGARVASEPLPAITLKGLSEPVVPYRPQARISGPTRSFARRLLGRERERQRLAERLRMLDQGQGGLVAVVGEAGIGKSHLLVDFADQARAGCCVVLSGEGDAIEQATGYFAWRKILSGVLDPSGTAAPATLRAELTRRLAPEPQLVSWAPLIEDVLPLGLTENEVTRQMVSAAREDSIREVIVCLLRQLADSRHVVLVLDDAHWCDANSLALTAAIVTRLPALLVVVGTRTVSDPALPELAELLDDPQVERLDLSSLPREAIHELVGARLGVDALPAELAQLIWTRAEGHPFYSEELALALREAELIRIEGGEVMVERLRDGANLVSLATSLQGIITSRIDRLPLDAQLAVKAASVIGRRFSRPMLDAVHPSPDRSDLVRQLALLEEHDIIQADASAPEQTYSFKHVIIRDVAYDSMLYTQRRQLHRKAAEWIETRYADGHDPYYAVLAYHWQNAGEVARSLVCLEHAGERALRGFANREAIGFISQGQALVAQEAWEVDPERRSRWHRHLGDAHLGLSHYEVAQGHYRQALQALGLRFPSSRTAIALDLGRGIARQILHRTWPGFAGRRSELPRWRDEAMIFKGLSETALFLVDTPAMLDSVFRHVNAAEKAGATSDMLHGYGRLSIVLGMLGLRPVARAYNARALALAERAANLHDRTYAWEMAAVHGVGIADWALVDDACARVAQGFMQLGDRFRWETGRCIQGFAHLARGAFTESYAAFAEAYDSAASDGAHQVLIWARSGQLAGLSLRGAAESAIVAELEQHADERINSTDALLALGLLAQARMLRGEAQPALACAERALEIMTTSTPVLYYFKWPVAAVAEVYAALSQSGGYGRATREGFQRKAGVAHAVLRRIAFMNPVAKPAADLVGGCLAWNRGRPRLAQKLWRRSATAAERLRMPYEQARARYELGLHLPPAHPERSDQRRRATAIFEALGAPPTRQP